ncbi:endo-1,4-beta-glucanase [Streptomyces sp. NPDC017993]|uniref:GH12 family glycosyl hydrolase domain-containing protein n=1 Tax=Streptomyces sp. NPDC017993 TaxID=3365027 RepID=UPI00378E6777
MTVTLAALAGLSLYAVDVSSQRARAASGCGAYESIGMGKYWLNNNTWGADNGGGSSCIWDNYRSCSTIGWGTAYEWSGGHTAVKSYAGSVLGRHWGWKSQETGLPVRISARTPVRSKWEYQVTESQDSVYNVAYDLWLHDKADADWQSDPRHEVMIWLARDGGAAPLGTRRETVQVDGAAWDLHVGDIGWNVYSFVRVRGTTSADLDLNDFLQALARRGLVAGSPSSAGGRPPYPP